jgi:hypothetical protein
MADDTRPLSPGQEALWTAHRMAPDSAAYNMVMAFVVFAPLHVPTLAQAVRAVMARHELLSSRFDEVDGRPRRTVPHRDTDGPVPLRVRDLSRPGSDVDGTEMCALLSDCAGEPFALETDPPWRVVLVRAPTRTALAVVIHHVAADFTSMWLVLRDLLDAYLSLADTGRTPWSSSPGRWDDHVDAERSLLDSPAGERAQRFWREVCDDAVPAELPTDRPRPAVTAFRGDTVRLRLAPADYDRLTAVAKRVRVSRFAYLLGTFQALVYRFTGQPDFLLGCPATTRWDRELRDTVGYFVNTFPVRARLSPHTTFRQAAESAYRQVTGGLAHVRYPGSLLTLGRGAAARAPLFRITFLMLAMDRVQPRLEPPGNGEIFGQQTEYRSLRLAGIDLPQQEGQLDLIVRIHHWPDRLDVVFSYRTDLFDRSSVESLMDYFGRMIRAAIAEPDARVSRVQLADARELAHLESLGTGGAGGGTE